MKKSAVLTWAVVGLVPFSSMKKMPFFSPAVFRFLVAITLTLDASSGTIRAQELRQLTDGTVTGIGLPAIDDAGTTVHAATSTDPVGTNPRHAWQVASWPAIGGSATFKTAFADGVAPFRTWYSVETGVSVSDDGLRIAFVSPADPVGQNHDESLEIFLMDSDGTDLVQVTNDPAPNAGSVRSIALSGSGNKVAFVANTDPLGTNPNNILQLFIVNTDGTGLRQLTSTTTEMGADEFTVGLSDDGSRVAFNHRGNLTGGNASGVSLIYAINADGTGLRLLTPKSGTKEYFFPQISGNGEKVCYEYHIPSISVGVYGINWDGTGVLLLTPASGSYPYHPSITDDGLYVIYADSYKDTIQNPEGNGEIWKVKTDGTGRTALTSTASLYYSSPTVSGSGNRIVFTESLVYLKAMDGSGGNIVTLGSTFDSTSILPHAPDITPDGTRLVFKGLGGAIYRIQTDGTDLVQLTTPVEYSHEGPSVSGDGSTIVFYSYDDPLGENPEEGPEIFAVQSDGTGLRQLTHNIDRYCPSVHPVIAANASVVVFQGGNCGAELFRVNPDGTGLVQVTNDGDGLYKWPRIDESGTWVTYQTWDGVFRIKTDGTSLLQISSDGVGTPDISGSGDRIVYTSNANPLGTNADLNEEVFLYEVSTATRLQLTFTTGTAFESIEPRISKNGEYVYFKRSAPFFETNPDKNLELWRVTVATGAIERVGALRRGPSSTLDVLHSLDERDFLPAIDETGNIAAFAGEGDWADENPSYDWELYLADFSAARRIDVSKASPTVLSWMPEPSPLRYDVIRGDAANLAEVAGIIDLGPVVCLEDDSPDATTDGFGDATDPSPGQAFFFVHRGSQGLGAGPGSYGKSSSGLERVAGAGGCIP